MLSFFSLPAQIDLPAKHPSESLDITALPVSMGLSQNMILCVLQDRQGFLWVGTKHGLNRFDGYQFKTFRNAPFDSLSLSSNRVENLLEDHQGRLWVKTSRGLNLYDADRACFRRIPSSDAKLLDEVAAITFIQDSLGHFWMGTNQHGLLRIRVQEDARSQWPTYLTVDQYQYPPEHPSYLTADHPKHIEVDGKGTLWVRARNNLARIQIDSISNELRLSDNFDQLADDQWRSLLEAAQFQRIGAGPSGKIWIGIHRGLVAWDPQQQQFSTHQLFKEDAREFWSHLARDIVEDSRGNVWICHFSGLIKYDPNTGEVHNYYGGPENPLLAHGVETIFEDRTGVIWIATRGRGLCKLLESSQRFAAVNKTNGEPGLWQGTSIRSVFKTSRQELWIGSAESYLARWDTVAREFIQQSLIKPDWDSKYQQEDFKPMIYRFVEQHPDSLWVVSTYGLHTLVYDESTAWSNVYHDNFPYGTIFWDMLPADEGEFWLLSNTTLFRYQFRTNEVESYEYLPKSGDQVWANEFPTLFKDDQEAIWIGSPSGLFHFDPLKKTFKHYTHDPGNPSSLWNQHVKAIAADPHEPDRYLWVGTAGGGLNRLDRASGEFRHFGIEDGLPDQVIYRILTDDDHQFWLSTNNGLAVFNPKDFSCRHFGKEDGLQENEFNSMAASRSADGEFFFGGINGFNRFYPDEMLALNPYLPTVVLTDFKVANQSVTSYEEGSPLRREISQAESAKLSWREKVFSIQFAALDFFAPNKHHFAYRMVGFDKDWQFVRDRNEATYTNLEPGRYTFEVKASNSDGLWSLHPTTLHIQILTPWWQQWWAYALYLLTPLLLIYYFWRGSLQRQRLQYDLEMEHLNSQQLADLNTMRARFYTNITHEFRTPLTVILGMVDQIGRQPKVHLQEGLLLIQRNGQQLLQLINQLLDLSKLENHSLRLQLQQGDIISFLRYITEAFQTYANTQNLSLQFFSTIEELNMDYDPVQVKQIMTNLISNAVKFTLSGGSIKVRVTQEDQLLCIEVSDTGIGIAEQDITYIFDRFYQADNQHARVGQGTGLGLAHTQELIQLMKGQISVRSQVQKGTQFKITLPIRRQEGIPVVENELAQNSIHLPRAAPIKDTDTSLNENTALPLLLIVEDNPDVVAYLKSCLVDDYRLIIAYNGAVGIKEAQAHIPDLIVSDVMMPEKNGFELCDTLKQDERTSHIPIILLTAKADGESKLTGLQTGADAYLSKPFDRKELLVRLEMMVKRQAQLSRYFSQRIRSNSSEGYATEKEHPIEEAFIQKVRQIVAKHYMDEHFALPQLCQKMGMSRSQLFRKMKALAQISPSEFIRNYRLEQAKILLTTTEWNISEVSWKVGFKDPAHFSRLFQEEFGTTPSATRK